jgi:DHA1 family bicyclomycin/chloramphenicol resistance-like MFS transporter
MILARTIVRDMHAGVRAGHLLAVMASIMGVVPILAPAIGGFLEAHFGWQSSFWVMTVVGVGSTALVIAALPETLGDLRADTLSVSSILRSYAIVASSPVFRAYAAFVCCGYAGLILYVGASSFIVQGRYGLSPIAYGFTFAMGAAAFIVGTYLGRVVARRTALNYAIGVGAAFLAAGGALLPLGIAFGPGNVAEFVIPVAIFMVGIGIVMPQSLAAALTPFPERAGAASSLLGFLQMSIAAIVLALTGVVLGDDALANACVLGVSGVGAGLIYLATRKARRS